MSRPRVMFWVQHLMGIGHQRRAAVIARRLCERGAKVCYVSGGYPVPGLDTGAADFVQLPPARAADLSYAMLVDENGKPVGSEWRTARRDALLKVFDAFRPQALVTESYPFGRGLLRFELEPLIERAHAMVPRPALLCSVRDIVHPRSAKRNAAIAALVASRFDAVLVHGDPSVVLFETSFAPAPRIADKLRYTGYVAEGAMSDARVDVADSSAVVVSAGGGAVAESLLRAALGAHPLSRLKALPWRIFAGAGVSEAVFKELGALAPGGVRVERNRADFPALLEACRVSISQAGYNTLVDVVQARVRAVVVPFSDAGQSEQPTRARLFAEKGLVRVVASEHLNPKRLAAAIDSAAASDRPAPGILDTNGAERSAETVIAAIGGRP